MIAPDPGNCWHHNQDYEYAPMNWCSKLATQHCTVDDACPIDLCDMHANQLKSRFAGQNTVKTVKIRR